MKKFIKFSIVTFLIFMLPVICNAACTVLIDSTELACSDANGSLAEPFIYEGSVYVPVRAVASAFDISVSWDQDTKTVFLGSDEGQPLLDEHINIFAHGKEFICYDTNNERVYPILSDGTTYLPLRGISALFGKNIYWDNVTHTAVLSTPPDDEAIDYLKNSISNTAAVSDLNALVTVDGSISHNGVLFSSISNTATERYLPIGFSLSEFLPINYTENVSYLGQGNYFLVVPSERFSSDPTLQKSLFDRNMPTNFSSLYISLSTKGGYITNVKIYMAGVINYRDIIIDEAFTFSALMQYPDSFSFPLIPSPGNDPGSEQAYISAAAGENSDSTLISSLVKKYMSALMSSQPKSIMELLHPDDNASLLSHKTSSQINFDILTIEKKLSAIYENAQSYTLESLVYTDPSALNSKPDNAAKAIISILFVKGDNSWADDHTLTLIKKDGKWYIDIDFFNDMYNNI